MSEGLRLRDVSGRPADDGLFEVLKTDLREHSRGRLLEALEERTAGSEERLSDAYQQAAPEEQKAAERDYALGVMALYPFVKDVAHYHDASAPGTTMAYARSRLAARMLQNPDQRALKRSVFFADSRKQRRFMVSVSARIEPYGAYDDRTFALALLNGEFGAAAHEES